jgi:hypothetical protein
MTTRSWLRNLFAPRTPRRAPEGSRKAPHRARLAVEALEDRTVPATFTVTNTLDDGSVGSLRWAVGQANSTPGPDTIDFDSGVFNTPRTITLGGTQLELTDAATTTIIGPGEDLLSISGGTNTLDQIIGKTTSRVFAVDSGASAALSGLTITGGSEGGLFNNSNLDGGGLVNFGDLTLTNCSVSDNILIPSVAGVVEGGGVYNTGTLTMSNCLVNDNDMAIPIGAIGVKDGYGGGVYNTGTLTMTDCGVNGNVAVTSGGGVLNVGTLTMTDCGVAGNERSSGFAADDGGGVSNRGPATMTDCTIVGNGNGNGSAFGGGVSNTNTLEMTNCTVSDNTAGAGGGVGNGGFLSMTNCTVKRNTATQDGGGVGSGGFLSMTNCTVSDNSATQDGGGISSGLSLRMTNCTVSDNSATRDGGGIDSGSGELTLDESTVGGNTAGGNGGGIIYNNATLTITDSTVAFNQAAGNYGPFPCGGIFIDSDVPPGDIFLANTIVADNVSGTGATPDDFNGGVSRDSTGNLIGNASGASGFVPGNGNLLNVDPRLGPLANNGGPTLTYALLSGSPAIDAGNNSAVPRGDTDQRGLPRIVNGAVDIGACEVQPLATTTAVTTTAAPSTYGDSVTFTATVTGFFTPTGSVNFVIDGGTPVAGIAGGTTGITATWTFTTSTLAAGTHTVEAVFDGTGDFTDSTGTLSGGQVVNKANATVVVTPYTVTYDGSPHTATYTITGVHGETGAAVGTVTLSTTHTGAGTYSDSWSFVGTANYHDIASTTITDVINKAPSTTTVTIGGGPFTYNGLPQTPATVTVTGAGGLSLTPAANDANNINAGTATASYVFAGDANHTGSSDSKNFSIGKADATVVVTPYSVTYDGTPHTATVASITGVNGETGAAVGAVTLNTTHTNPGTYASDSWSFAGSPNYKDIASRTITDTINKATLTITANDDSKISGTLETFSSTAFTQTGLVSGDTITGVTETSTGAAAAAAVGTYPIVPSAATGTGLGNYNISYVNGTLTVFSPPPTPSPAPPVSDPLILLLSPIEGRALRGTVAVAGLGFTPGSVLLVNGQPLATLFVDGSHLLVPGFLPQLQRLLRVRRHGRLVYVDDGMVAVQVLVPGVGLSPVVLLLVEEVAPGDIGTAAERAIADSWERRHQQEADTSPDFARILRRLRAHGI